ncbi:MAG TPA: arginine--tRNA ligase, partial [Burkholderiaceae bacterium]|nr:arginine--tRNA ligase [Burkholderiaceae bacterium]
MIQAKEELLHALRSALSRLAPDAASQAVFESPKHSEHGDLAVTAAMGLAKSLRRPPRDIAKSLVESLREEGAVQRWVDALEVAGPGFVNLRLKAEARQRIVREVLQAAEAFGQRAAHGGRVMVEFVSANPTGPLHVGHGRNAALGDCVCNL